MRRRVIFLLALVMSAIAPVVTVAAPQDDVSAATRAWAEAYNSRDPQKVQALSAFPS